MLKATCHSVMSLYFAVEDKKTSPLLDNFSYCKRLQTLQDYDKINFIIIQTIVMST